MTALPGSVHSDALGEVGEVNYHAHRGQPIHREALPFLLCYPCRIVHSARASGDSEGASIDHTFNESCAALAQRYADEGGGMHIAPLPLIPILAKLRHSLIVTLAERLQQDIVSRLN